MDANQLRFNQMCAAMMLDALPEQQDFATPFDVGYMDGEEGLTCDPLAYGYIKLADCEQYVLGWREGMHVEDTEDLIDAVAEQDFIRHGGA